MPSGDVHYKYFKKGYRIIIPLSVALSCVDWKFASGHIVGYSCGRWIDPDWDLVTANNSESRMMNELPILGNFLFGISSTYGSFYKRKHRSFWSHFPVVSTVIRLIFVFTIPFIIGDSVIGINFLGQGWYRFWIGFLVGLSEADAIHWWLDKTYGGV